MKQKTKFNKNKKENDKCKINLQKYLSNAKKIRETKGIPLYYTQKMIRHARLKII